MRFKKEAIAVGAVFSVLVLLAAAIVIAKNPPCDSARYPECEVQE